MNRAPNGFAECCPLNIPTWESSWSLTGASFSRIYLFGGNPLLRGLPRRRLPCLTGIAPLRLELVAFTALFLSFLPRFKLPNRTASGTRYGLSAAAAR